MSNSIWCSIKLCVCMGRKWLKGDSLVHVRPAAAPSTDAKRRAPAVLVQPSAANVDEARMTDAGVSATAVSLRRL